MKKRVIYSIICMLVAGFCLAAMLTTPLKYAEYVHNDQDVVASYQADEAVKKTDTTLLYHIEQSASDYVTIKLTESMGTPIFIKVFLYEEDLENSVERFNLAVPAGQEYVSLNLTGYHYQNIELDLMQGVNLVDNMEYHAQDTQIIETSPTPSKARVLVAFLLVIAVGAGVFLVDWKFHVLDRIHWRKPDFKKVLKGVIWFAGITVVALILELAIAFLCRKLSDAVLLFNYSRFFFIEALLLIVYLFIKNKSQIVNKVEHVVFWLIMIIGMAMILILPPKHDSWDVDSHYQWALDASSLGKNYMSETDFNFYYVYSDTFAREDRQTNIADQARMNREYKYIADVYYGEISISHIPAGLGIAITRFLRFPFMIIYKAGEVMNLILYAVLCYFAVKKLKSGKMILATIAMFPTSLLMASSYSYDYWVTGFALLGMAYFIGNCQRKDEYISTKDTIIMVAAFALACIPKQVYIMFMLIPFFMPRNKIENKKKYYAICASGFVFLLISLGLRSAGSIGGTGDTRGGAVNPKDQILYILSDIPNYARIMTEFLLGYFSLGTVAEYTTNFAYLGLQEYGVSIIIILLIVVTVTDKEACDEHVAKWYTRVYMILMFICTSVLMASAMYIAFTPVGLNQINGCQPRYLVPLLYPLLAVIGSGKITNKMNRVVYNYAVLGIMSAVVMYGVYDTMLVRMM